jgi:hypothetical protein
MLMQQVGGTIVKLLATKCPDLVGVGNNIYETRIHSPHTDGSVPPRLRICQPSTTAEEAEDGNESGGI